MKKIFIPIVGLLSPVALFAANSPDDFDDFIKQEMLDFKSFIDEADRSFVEFLRNPWVQIKAQPAEKQRTEPEPETPIVCDDDSDSKPKSPISLDELLKKSSKESEPVNKKNLQNPVGEMPVDRTTPEAPEVSPLPQQDTIPVGQSDDIPELENTVSAPEPPRPTVPPTISPEQTTPLVETPEVIAPVPQEQPKDPLFTGGESRAQIVYNSCNLYVDNSLMGKCQLSGTDENSIANAYENLCTNNSTPIISDIKKIREKFKLNDWGMYTLVESISKAFCSNKNSQVVMQQYLLNELGLSTKIARMQSNNSLTLLTASDCMIYARPSITFDGVKYFCFENTKETAFYICPKNSSKAKNAMQMEITTAPDFGGETTTTSHKSSDGAISVNLNVSKSLMSFYKSYPQCDYNVYATAPINAEVETPLLNAVAQAIAGKSESQAADMILNFIQTGFEYATDEQQFGYEKPFFVEEVFYYPQCDCEDRAVIYRYLVKKLLGLDVILISYPNHLATAVCFNEDIPGYYITYDNKRYTVCDPTYIGASIGNCMPNLQNISPKVVKVNS